MLELVHSLFPPFFIMKKNLHSELEHLIAYIISTETELAAVIYDFMMYRIIILYIYK